VKNNLKIIWKIKKVVISLYHQTKQKNKVMTPADKKLFTKEQRLDILKSYQFEQVKMYSALLNRLVTKYPTLEADLIKETTIKVKILKTRLSKFK
jgi:hypothetical protein